MTEVERTAPIDDAKVGRRRRDPGRLVVVLVVLGAPLAFIVADRAVALRLLALDACGDVGLVPGFAWLFTMIWMVPLMWAGWTLSIVVGRRHLLSGIAVGLLVLGGVAMWWLSGTTEAIVPYDDKSCPGGVPPWWPSWLPH